MLHFISIANTAAATTSSIQTTATAPRQSYPQLHAVIDPSPSELPNNPATASVSRVSFDELLDETDSIYNELAQATGQQANPAFNPELHTNQEATPIGQQTENNPEVGFGKISYPNGGKYEGFWKNNKRDGFGLENKQGFTYFGEWVNDQYHGTGIRVDNSGTVYEGKWKQGKLHGKVTAYFANRNIFHGEYFEGKRNGEGIILYPDGKAYEGLWQDDRTIHTERANYTVHHQDDAMEETDYSNSIRSQISQEVLNQAIHITRQFRNASNLQGDALINARSDFITSLSSFSPQLASMVEASYGPAMNWADICACALLATQTLSRSNPNRGLALQELIGDYSKATTDQGRARALDAFWQYVILPNEQSPQTLQVVPNSSSTSNLAPRVSIVSARPFALTPNDNCFAMQATKVTLRSLTPAIALLGPIPAAVAIIGNLILDLTV